MGDGSTELLLDGDIDDIIPGTFVSFKYSRLAPGGKPFNPQVSIQIKEEGVKGEDRSLSFL